MDSPRKPNLFIVGAPKCGTTAWFEYLKSHPEIAFSESKEPHYFCDDFPGFRWAKNETDYLQLFSGLPNKRYIGEASVMYLYSSAAIPAIYTFNQAAKVLVFTRDYQSFFQSYHSQIFFTHDEDVADLSQAWNLQESRRRGENIPKSCREVKFLQYKDVCSFGDQLSRVYSVFPKDQVLVFEFEKWVREPRKMYLRVMEFLELDDDGRTDFRTVNAKRQSRSRIFSYFLQRPPSAALLISAFVKKLFGIERLKFAAKLRKFNEVKKITHQPIGDELSDLICEELKQDRLLFKELMNR
jgi:Sulfotransferase domain